MVESSKVPEVTGVKSRISQHPSVTQVPPSNSLNNEEQNRAKNPKPTKTKYLTVEPEKEQGKKNTQKNSQVFQPGLDTVGRDTEGAMADRSPYLVTGESPETAGHGAELDGAQSNQFQKSQRSTVISHVRQVDHSGSLKKRSSEAGLNQTGSSANQYYKLAQQSMNEIQNQTISQKGYISTNQLKILGNSQEPLIYEVNDSSAQSIVDQSSMEGGPPLDLRMMSAQPVEGQSPEKRGHRKPHAVKANKLDKNQKANEVISQTLFSSYNDDSDSNSNHTLHFNRNISRMSLTTTNQKSPYEAGPSVQVQVQQESQTRKDEQSSSRHPALGNKKVPTQVSPNVLPASRQMHLVYENSGVVGYQPLQPVNLGELSSGPIPMTTRLDDSGNLPEIDELMEAKARAKELEQKVVQMTGQRSPIQRHIQKVKSPKAKDLESANPPKFSSPPQPNYSATHRPPNSSRKLNEAAQKTVPNVQAQGGQDFQIGGNKISRESPEAERDRRSPFQSSKNVGQPMVSVVVSSSDNKVKRRHQSPPKYDISELPQHLNKTLSRDTLGGGSVDSSNTQPIKLEESATKGTQEGFSVTRKRLHYKLNGAQVTTLPLGENAIDGVLADQHLHSTTSDHPNKTSRGDMQRHKISHVLQEQQQFISVAVSPMLSGSELMSIERERRQNITGGLFSNSNSSEPPSQLPLGQSGLSYEHKRKMLLKDVATGQTNNSRNDTFQTLQTGDTKTYLRTNRVQDVIAGAYQDKADFEKPLVLKKKTYHTPIRQRASNNDFERGSLTARSASVKPELVYQNTMERAADRNMFGKKPAPPQPASRNLRFISARASEPNVARRRLTTLQSPAEKAKEVPKSLYVTNGYMPSLADLRDAIRNNSMFHNRYNPHLETPEVKKAFATAIKRQPNEVEGIVNEEYENQTQVLDLLIPVHQQANDRRQAKLQKEIDYMEQLHTRTQQKLTQDRLISTKLEKYAKMEVIRQKELLDAKKKANQFKARPNPLQNNDTADSIEQFLALKQRNPKRNLLFNFIAEKKFQDITLPSSMFDCPLEQQKRIARFIEEANQKMRAADNDNQKFDRLKRQVEELVEQGMTFKQPPQPKKVSFKKSKTGHHSEVPQETQGESFSKKKRLSMRSPSLSSFKSTSQAGLKERDLDPTVVDNDHELPKYLEPRVRPAPNFQPKSASKPHLLKASRKEPQGGAGKSGQKRHLGLGSTRGDDLNLRETQYTAPSPRAKYNITLEQQPGLVTGGEDLRNLSLFEDRGLLNTQVEGLLDTQSIRMSESGAQDLRTSKDQLRKTPGFVQTHHQALRQSMEKPLEFLKGEDGDLTVNIEDQKPTSSVPDSNDYQDAIQIQNQSTSPPVEAEPDFRTQKIEIAADIRKSLARDNSAMLPQITLNDIDLEGQTPREGGQQVHPILINSNSAEGQIGLAAPQRTGPTAGTADQQMPYQAVLSQQFSQKQFTIQPSVLTTNLPQVKGQAREKLLREKRVEMLHKPELNNSSCNHCISKAVTKHEKAMEQLALSSIASTYAGVTAAGTSTKASALNNATTEFLSVSPSQGHLHNAMSLSQLHTTQLDSNSNLQSNLQVSEWEATQQRKAYAKLAKNAPKALKGLLAQCDAHVKVSKHTNTEFESELRKRHKEAEHGVSSMVKTIDSTLEAQEEVPLWDQIQELAKMEHDNNQDIMNSMAHQKKNIDREAIINMLKWDQENKKTFKPSGFKYDPEIEKFLKQRFERSND